VKEGGTEADKEGNRRGEGEAEKGR